jgi:hypothetical protein
MVSLKKTSKLAKQRLSSARPDYTPPGPVKRRIRIYSKREKKQVRLFLYHHRIPQTLSYNNRKSTPARINPTRVFLGLEDPVENGFRRPTAAEAAAYFKIDNRQTIYS